MLWLYILGAIIVIALITIFVIKESTGFVTEHYDFYSDKLSEDFHFVFISDLHEVQHGKKNEKLLEAIKAASPDYILLGGDIITSYKKIDDYFEDTIDFLYKLSEISKVIFTPGNHEHALFDIRDCEINLKACDKDEQDIDRINRLEKCLNDCNIPILRNDNLYVDQKNVRIYGLDLDLKYYRRVIRRAPESDCIEKLLGKVDSNPYTIMLAHDPEHFKEYSQWGCDLVLSGHLHGGIVKVPGFRGVISPQLKLFPKYDAGVFSLGTAKMLLTRGIGTHSVPVRVFNKAEVCDVIIHKNNLQE